MARKILLADDSVTAQNMGRKILADAGYEVITVNNGSAALKKIAEHKPDLIVLDVYMPGYSGLEVCQRLKEAQETSRVPVLLTVGKLEPFKPEESRRVRADGFIVKPFEASELLSALSKLEDKIVPRGEGAKPGRLARVTASLDEGRFDRTVAMDDDSGWKNRLSFPSKKKEKSAAEDEQGNAISIEQKAAEKRQANKANEARVDLGALAPEGLPKDVTAEEIAALAAAAAKVKGKIAEFSEDTPALAHAEKPAPAEKIEESQVSDALPQEFFSAAAPVVDQTIEEKREEKPAETIEEKPEKEVRVEATPDKFSESPAAAASFTPANNADLMAAIAGLDPGDAASPTANSGNGLSSQRTADAIANGPVTMAIAAAAGSMGEPPRWAAVSVAVDKEEAAISLEHEMQKAYAAFAAAVAGEAISTAAVSDSRVESVEFAAAKESSPEPQSVSAEPVSSIAAAPESQIAQALPGLSNASTEAIRAAVQDLEMISESSPAVAVPSGFESAPATETEAVRVSSPQTSPNVEGVAKETPISDGRESQPEAAKVDAAQRSEVDSWTGEARSQEAQNQGPTNHDPTNHDLKHEDQANEEHGKPVVAAAATPTDGADKQFVAAPASSDRGTAELTSANSGSSSETIKVQETPASGEIAKGDSDGAASTAAAWASWRKIRESGHSTASSGEQSRSESKEPSTRPDAAMAVAAGAEKTPKVEEADSDPAAIASIVDSVLADLRPRIFEEISRKMGKKK